MTWTRHTEEQIIAALQNVQAGIGVQELSRKHGDGDVGGYSKTSLLFSWCVRRGMKADA